MVLVFVGLVSMNSRVFYYVDGLGWFGLMGGCLYMVFLFCFERFGGLLWNCLFGLFGLLFWIAVWIDLVGGFVVLLGLCLVL